MQFKFSFYKGQQNSEILRVNISDPGNISVVKNEDGNLDPSKIDKIELIAGDIVISSENGEITWVDDIFTITPSSDNINLLSRRSFAELVVYKDGRSATAAKGYVFIANLV
jgi:hypothetical protein